MKVQVVGGLGNQLFGLAAGLAFAHRNDQKLTVDLSQVDKGVTAHGVSLTDFSFETSTPFFYEAATHPIQTPLRKIAYRFGELVHSKERGPLSKRIPWWYTSGSPKVDRAVFENFGPRVTHLRGYFQSSFFYEYCVNNSLIRRVTVSDASPEFQNIEAGMFKTEVTSIHVRRGDYYKPEVRMDVVPRDWYVDALKRIERPTSQILIFSDEPNHKDVAYVATATGGKIASLQGLSPAEELILMSRATNLICSNSTFSWWAAALSEMSGQVVFPKRWTGDLGDDNWIGFPKSFDSY